MSKKTKPEIFIFELNKNQLSYDETIDVLFGIQESSEEFDLNDQFAKAVNRIVEHCDKKWLTKHVKDPSNFQVSEILNEDEIPRIILNEGFAGSLTKLFMLAGLKAPKEIYDKRGRLLRMTCPCKDMDKAMAWYKKNRPKDIDASFLSGA